MVEWNELTEQQKDNAMEAFHVEVEKYKVEHPEEDYGMYEN